MARTNDYVEPKTIASLKDLLIEGEEMTLDLTEDAWSFGAPPPFGYYQVKLFLDKDGMKQGLNDNNNPNDIYITFKLIAKITEGEYEGTPIYTQVTTKVWRGKEISTMAGLIVKLGYKFPNKLTPKKLAMYMEQALKKEPTVIAEVDWQGSYAYPDPKDPNKNKYQVVFKNYSQFPEDKEHPGEKLDRVIVSNQHGGGTVEVRAMTQINRYFGKGDELPKPKQQKVNGAVVVPQLVTKEPELMLPKGVVTGVVASTVATSDEGDFDLMLAEG
jgi:hypothetical protein